MKSMAVETLEKLILDIQARDSMQFDVLSEKAKEQIEHLQYVIHILTEAKMG